MGRKSAFNKNNSVTFKVVHRSQQDPLVADERAPQNVLLPTSRGKRKSRKEEQIKYGIYFDDDYDYLQHLKDVGREWSKDVGREEGSKDVGREEGSKDVDGREWSVDWDPVSVKKKKKKPQIMLPSSVFASEVEEKEGLLNRAALPRGPQPGWDPDVVAALDDDFDFDDPENQLEDDFFVKMLGAEGGVEEEEDESDENENENVSDDEDENENVSDDEDEDENVSDDDTVVSDAGSKTFSEEETKTCFTNYSMTSSVMRRSEGLTMLDDRFEALYEKEYADDTEIGCLNEGDEDGYIDVNKSEVIRKLIGDKRKDEEDRVYVNQMIGQRFKYEDSNEPTVQVQVDDLERNEEPEFDCQSIISTYSNLYNHPKIIYENNSKKVKVNPKTGIPVLSKPGLTAEHLRQLDSHSVTEKIPEHLRQLDSHSVTEKIHGSRSVRSTISKISELSTRDKNETPEERRARKEALKEYRRERRAEKKANKLCFKLEETRQVKEMINLEQNLTTVKLC